MGLTITPSDATLGARVTDVTLAELDDACWPAIEAAFHEHAVLVFPGQHLDAGQQVAFARRFGAIERLLPGSTLEIVPLTNRRGDGSRIADDEDAIRILRGNEGWHTDSSYMPVSAKASVLTAHVVPPEGGETEWADMRAAYDALDAGMRERVESLCAYHSLYHSQAKIGHVAATGFLSGFHEEGAPLRPLLKPHPVTGRKALFLGRHAYGVPGLSETSSEELLDELLAFACQPPRVFAHRWQPGDLVIWDNRCVLHRARPYDYAQPRTMLHVRVAGDPRSERAQTNPMRR